MDQPKGTQGSAKTAAASRKELNRLMKDYSLEEIGKMVDRSPGILSSIRKGDTMPPDSLLAKLRAIKSKGKGKEMKMAELVLSEVANSFGIQHGSADTAEDIGKMIVAHVDGLQPLELSERETSLVQQNREGQIDMLLSEGQINPSQAKDLKAAFASTGDLMLSEGDDALSPADRAFSTIVSVLKNGKHRKPSDERSGNQDQRQLELSEGDQGDAKKNPLEAIAQKKLDAANA